jgi:hypothetical protein
LLFVTKTASERSLKAEEKSWDDWLYFWLRRSPFVRRLGVIRADEERIGIASLEFHTSVAGSTFALAEPSLTFEQASLRHDVEVGGEQRHCAIKASTFTRSGKPTRQ